MLLVDILEIIVWLQIAVIGMLFYIQPTREVSNLVILYSFTLAIHAVLFQFTPDFSDKYILFYVLGGALDLYVIIKTCMIIEVSRLVSSIQDISLVSIMFNTLGLSLNHFGFLPEAYMLLFVALYSWAIWVLFRKEIDDDGCFEVDTRLFAFNRHAHRWNMFSTWQQGKK